MKNERWCSGALVFSYSQDVLLDERESGAWGRCRLPFDGEVMLSTV